MPRRLRFNSGSYVDHALNRALGRAGPFHKESNVPDISRPTNPNTTPPCTGNFGGDSILRLATAKPGSIYVERLVRQNAREILAEIVNLLARIPAEAPL